ncbi:M-phase phosphoprotein 6 [Manduca sexta]|uniref:M-phase phosphoprotein 6 n=1 Tax=Manduca sexta TaxID=7130 RepID=A0A922CQF7_MANSE|nr:M-phase phosphoprotein 6 [Manduca sexta]KAG6454053.1 hypothetical protein O3G_MSEX008463 [Manduca sexta]
MANITTKKPQLPKSVLDMKFMKKTKERIERELENTHDHGNLYSNIITNEMRSASGNYISESSFLYCEDLIEGRLSFKGMNPDIEKLMVLETQAEQPNSEMQKDVSDEILAKKFKAFNKRKRPMETPSKYSFIKKRK